MLFSQENQLTDNKSIKSKLTAHKLNISRKMRVWHFIAHIEITALLVKCIVNLM